MVIIVRFLKDQQKTKCNLTFWYFYFVRLQKQMNFGISLKIWKMIKGRQVFFQRFFILILSLFAIFHHTIWFILISSNLPFMEQYLKLNYIPNKKCSAGQSWSVCNKASLLLKNTLYGHMKTLMKIPTQENNSVTSLFPSALKYLPQK